MDQGTRISKIKAKLSQAGLSEVYAEKAAEYMEKNDYGLNQFSTKVLPYIRALDTEKELITECPNCAKNFSILIKENKAKFITCEKCRVKIEVKSDGRTFVIGPKQERLGKAESLDINEDRICSQCQFFISGKSKKRKFSRKLTIIFGVIYSIGIMLGGGLPWVILGAIVLLPIYAIVLFFGPEVLEEFFGAPSLEDDACNSNEAVSLADTNEPRWINRNNRCRFWIKNSP